MNGHGGRARHAREQDTRRARKALDLLKRTLEIRDPVTAAHARQVAELSSRVGHFIGITGDDLADLELAACFHDIGKTAVPDEVLLKPAPLDTSEWRTMTCHAEWGAELLRHLPGCAPVAPIVRHHHERWDGQGYPDGLARGEIPRASRIIGVCDAYDAMITDRPYRAALDPGVARSKLREAAGSHFDPDAVDALLGAIAAPRFRRTASLN
jgi:HD-GYP domain-containing protein (c-di-GMP phosphodiesterase class II)